MHQSWCKFLFKINNISWSVMDPKGSPDRSMDYPKFWSKHLLIVPFHSPKRRIDLPTSDQPAPEYPMPRDPIPASGLQRRACTDVQSTMPRHVSAGAIHVPNQQVPSRCLYSTVYPISICELQIGSVSFSVINWSSVCP